jgi:hypothetical protein
MSRAFVKETAESAPPPERMVDEGPNLVTPEGLAQIEAHQDRRREGDDGLDAEPAARQRLEAGEATAISEAVCPAPL